MLAVEVGAGLGNCNPLAGALPKSKSEPFDADFSCAGGARQRNGLRLDKEDFSNIPVVLEAGGGGGGGGGG